MDQHGGQLPDDGDAARRQDADRGGAAVRLGRGGARGLCGQPDAVRLWVRSVCPDRVDAACPERAVQRPVGQHGDAAERRGELPVPAAGWGTEQRRLPDVSAGAKRGQHGAGLAAAGDSVASYVLPSVALGARYAGSMARITRTSMLEVMGQDYIRTARAKGVRKWAVILKHALKNALIPIVTLIGTDFGYMLTGSMLIEKVFSIPGIGKLAVDAMSNRDLPLLEGTVMYIAFVFVIVNLIVDLSYAFLDPRIRYGKGVV